MNKKDLGEVPFCKAGMCHPWSRGWGGGEEFTVPDVPWEDRLVYVGILKGRSMLQFEFNSLNTGLRFFFLTKDFDALMKSGKFKAEILDGKIQSDSGMLVEKVQTSVSGTFEFIKRGSSYGIKLVE